MLYPQVELQKIEKIRHCARKPALVLHQRDGSIDNARHLKLN